MPSIIYVYVCPDKYLCVQPETIKLTDSIEYLMIQCISKKLVVVVPLLLLAVAAMTGGVGNVKAWDGDGNWGGCGGFGCGYHMGYFHHWGFHNFGSCCGQELGGCCQPQVNNCCDNGQDGYQSSDIGQCCGQDFGQGYHQTDQTSKQGTSINVINSPGATVSTNQESNQQLQPLQHLVQGPCTITAVNCAQAQPYQDP